MNGISELSNSSTGDVEVKVNKIVTSTANSLSANFLLSNKYYLNSLLLIEHPK